MADFLLTLLSLALVISGIPLVLLGAYGLILGMQHSTFNPVFPQSILFLAAGIIMLISWGFLNG